jgi:hypothetical protein
MKNFSGHDVFGSKQKYVEAIKAADAEKLAQLIKVCSFLLQAKVYLFWQAQ